MNDIRIIIPVADTNLQNFDNLVNELCGNYQPQDHVKETFMGDDNTEIILNPYKGHPCPDFTDKITLVSLEEVVAPTGADNVVVDSGLNIGKMWNVGVAHAAAEGATHVIVLNQVSSISPYVLVEAVENNADADIINLSDGGCFIVKPSVSASEAYHWWFTDNELLSREETVVYRNDFLDIVQENAIPIAGQMQTLVEEDTTTFAESQTVE